MMSLSLPVSGRVAPGARLPSFTGPNLVRTSRSTTRSRAAQNRLISRLRPSAIGGILATVPGPQPDGDVAVVVGGAVLGRHAVLYRFDTASAGLQKVAILQGAPGFAAQAAWISGPPGTSYPELLLLHHGQGKLRRFW